MMNRKIEPRRYLAALAIAAGSVIVRLLLDPLLGNEAPFLLFTLAIALCAYAGGLEAGLLATGLTTISGVVLFTEPPYSLHDAVHILLFLAIGLTISHIARFQAEYRQAKNAINDASVRLRSSMQARKEAEAEISQLNKALRERVEDLQRLEEIANSALKSARAFAFEWEVCTDKVERTGHCSDIVGLSGTGTGRDYFSHVCPEERSAFVDTVTGLTPENPVYSKEYRLERKDGVTVYLDEKGRGYFDQQGKLARVVGLAVDTTQRRLAEEVLIDADRKKDEFLAMLAHELRNPIAAISAAASILLRSEVTEDKARFAKESLIKRVVQLTRLIEDLLDVSRITAGKIQLHREPTELSFPVAAAIEACRSEFEEREQTLNVRMEEGVFVSGDVVRIEQIVTNLLTNASRYTQRNGAIEVVLGSEEDCATITVKDNGSGIPGPLLSRIFDLFHQGNNPTPGSGGGLGIGLTIVKKLCEMHDGTVEARSAGPGMGSEFRVVLPLCADRATASKCASSGHAVGGLSILVVEDDVDTGRMTAENLEMEGHRVELAFDAQSALEKAFRLRPDIVLLDIGLPGTDGCEVAKKLRSGGLDALIIAVTGFGRKKDYQNSELAGIDYHLLKPLDFEQLHSLINARIPQLADQRRTANQ